MGSAVPGGRRLKSLSRAPQRQPWAGCFVGAGSVKPSPRWDESLGHAPGRAATGWAAARPCCVSTAGTGAGTARGCSPHPPPPGTLLAAGPGAAAGAGPAARPGLPQGSCPHICIFPALPAVIGSPSARLVPARLRSPSASPSPACPARCLCLRCWAFLGRCPVPHKPCRDGAATRSLLGHGAGRTGEEGAARRGGRSRRRNSRVKPDPGFLRQRWLRPGD